MNYRPCISLLLSLCGLVSVGWADGNAVDKVYSPYVQQLERELEYRLVAQGDDARTDAFQRHKLGYGQSVSDRLFLEAYLVGQGEDESTLSVDTIELEAKIQLTEQGQYRNDWGVLFELEHNFEANFSEISSTLLAVQEWPQCLLTLNLSASVEFGPGISDEFETGFSSQLKYRYKQRIEPAIELFIAQDTRAIGPVLTGQYSLGKGDKLGWTAGVLFGQSNATPNTSVKLAVEYEF